MFGLHVAVYFGSDGRMLNSPFKYLFIIGCLPSVRPLIGSIKEDRAERDVFTEEYPTPVWKTDVKNSMVSFRSRQMGSLFRSK